MLTNKIKNSLALCLVAISPLGCSTSPNNAKPQFSTAHHVSYAPTVNIATTLQYDLDRKAILAMVGEFDVSFKFKESLSLIPDYKLHKTHRSAASEKVFLVKDAGNLIVLQHILVVGNENEHVVKHWLQEWRYEDNLVYAYQGDKTWKPISFTDDQVSGKWTQLVTHVDDSPRYESQGQWIHTTNTSYWESGVTWRPLPRREYTTRSDYDILVARNRHTLTPTGWVHEQDNEKLALRDNKQTIIAREYGLNTYNRTTKTNFSAADKYWSATSEFWKDVRDAWSDLYSQEKTLQLRKKADKQVLYKHFFEYAEIIKEDKKYDSVKGKAFIQDTLKKFQIK